MHIFLIHIRDPQFYALPAATRAANGHIRVMGFPPIGIMSLSAVLKRAGHECVMLVQANPETPDNVIIDAIQRQRPALVGLAGGKWFSRRRWRPEAWVDFMMRFELGLEKPDPRRALASAVTIALAYIIGGFIPLGPYIALKATMALPASVGITLLALAIFGYVKGHFTGASPVRSSLQTVLIGGLAAAAAFGVWRGLPWAAVAVVLLGASIAATWLIEGFVLGIVAYLHALLVAVLAIVVALVIAAYVNRQHGPRID